MHRRQGMCCHGKGPYEAVPVCIVGEAMADEEYDPKKREFELSLRKSAGGWAGKLSADEDAELRKLQEKEKNAMKRRGELTGQG